MHTVLAHAPVNSRRTSGDWPTIAMAGWRIDAVCLFPCQKPLQRYCGQYPTAHSLYAAA
jgi:hypothetical protein